MSQKSIVLKQLRSTGTVSRNWCLQQRITRLSAIMLDLKKDGITFEAKDKDGDYVYRLIDKPKQIIEYRVDNVVVSTKYIW